jgi:hypothetical protein
MILRIPRFQLTFPTVPVFLRSFLELAQAGETACEVANFFSELALIPIDFVGADPELIATACACLGQIATGGRCPLRRLMAVIGVEFARKVLAHPKHLLYQRYTASPAAGAIRAMELTEGVLDRLGR